jgi:hypothetical protein
LATQHICRHWQTKAFSRSGKPAGGASRLVGKAPWPSGSGSGSTRRRWWAGLGERRAAAAGRQQAPCIQEARCGDARGGDGRVSPGRGRLAGARILCGGCGDAPDIHISRKRSSAFAFPSERTYDSLTGKNAAGLLRCSDAQLVAFHSEESNLILPSLKLIP